jgi:nucleotide-binding universal stress UspA family protein
LTSASKEADLLIVGDRGVGGASSLGSVSKSVGHLAHCSVLVLREPPERRHT